MKLRPILFVLGLVGLLFTLALTYRQQQRLGTLRQQIRDLSVHATDLTNSAGASPLIVPASNTDSINPPSLELLTLRGQVGQLERQKRELAGASVEQHRLLAQLTNRATTEVTSVRLSPGYIRRSQARNIGQATPEAALETFMWAIEHRDLSTLMQCIDPKHRQDIEDSLKQADSDHGFFKGVEGLVGGLIMARKPQANGSVVLQLRVDPHGDDAENIQFRLVDGQWRLSL